MGKIRKIVNGVVVEVDENQPVKTIVDGVVVEKPLSEVKKKEVLGGGGTTAPVALVSGGTVGSSAPLSEREKIANYVKTLGGGVKQVSGDKTVGNTKAIVQAKPTKKAETTFDQTKEEAVSGGINKINEIMYDTNDDWKDPIKVSLEKSVDRTQGNKSNLEYLAANVLTRDAILKSGYNASKMLETTPIWAMAKPGENMTADLLKQKTAEFENKVRPFDEIQINEFDNGDGSGNDEFYKYVYGDKIYNAAIKAHALKNENFKDQLLAKGATYEDFENGDLMKFVPSGKLGQIVSESVYDPDVAEYLKNEKPYLFNGLKAVASSLIEDDKVFGANVVANKISREFLKKRNLSPLEYVADFATQGLKDEINEYAKNNLTEQEYRVYQNKILGNEEKYLDTPSLLEGFASGGKQIFSGIKSTFTTPFKSQSEIIDEGWKQEASNVSADPEGMLKFLRDSGHTLGIVAGIGATGNVLGGGGLGTYATKVVPALSGAIPFLGDMLQEGTMKYPDSPVKAWTSAMFNTALYAALSYRVFPAKDVEKAFTAVKPEVAVVVKNLTNGSITREVARKEMNTIAVKALDFLAGTQIKSGKIAAELTGISALNQMLDKVMGMDDKTYEKYHPEGELTDTFGSLFLSNQFVGGLAKYGEMKRGNRIVEASLYEAASNPLKFQREVELLKTKDESIDTNQILDNLKFLTEVKRELDARGIKPANQGRYMFEAMKEKVFADAVKSTPDSNMIRPMKESIKRGEEVKESILEGEDVVGNEQFELQKENKALSADQIALQKALEGKEIKDTLFASIAESAMKDPELAAQLVADIKSQATGEVAGEIGSAKSGQINSFGEGLVEYAINKKAGEPERVSQPIELDLMNMSDADIENEMTKLELSGDRDRFNLLEKEMVRRERDSVFSVQLDKVEDAIDALMKKNKEMPNGWGADIDKQEAEQTKAVARRYLKAKELTDDEVIKDFKDSMFGNPDTWYADGLKLRESMKEAANRGIEVRDLVKQIENEFISDGYTKEDAQEMVARKMAKILEGSTKVDESKMISNGQPKVEAGSVDVGGDGKKVYHGTSHEGEFDKESDGLIWFTDNKKIADQYRKRNVLSNEANWDNFEGDIDEVTESETGIDVFAEENGIDLTKGNIIEGNINPKKPLNFTEFDVNIDDVGEVWDALYETKLVKEKWEDFDEEQKEEIEDDYKGKAIWRMLEGENIYDEAKKQGYDAVIINDVGVDGKPHISYGLFGTKSFKSKPKEQSQAAPQKSDIDAKKEAIETEKQQAITEATKPVVDLELLGGAVEARKLIAKLAANDKDEGRAKAAQHERIRERLKALKKFIDCI